MVRSGGESSEAARGLLMRRRNSYTQLGTRPAT